MVESHFGFSGPPFQLNPDPAFYFESRGHGQALSYLRYGVQQGEGFIVVTGDAGTGKTTLVRTLLQQIDPRQLVAAQLSNTQLDATDLLQAILTAFGVRAAGTSKATAIGTIEAFLTSVAAGGRRALLVVDEAQNLGRAALEELRMLSNFQLGHHGLLQTFLVGQAPLRERLQSAELEQLRQRVLASCHLDALDADETAAYVLHRLQRVGWAGRPAFDADALVAVHRRTGGVPRRINMLCSRVLLAACLGDCAAVSGMRVDETATELLRELKGARAGDAGERERVSASAPAASTPAAAGRPARSAAVMSLSARETAATTREAIATAGDLTAPSPVPRRSLVASAPLPAGAWVGLAETPLAWAELQHLAVRAQRRTGLPPFVCVHPGVRDALPALGGSGEGTPGAREVHLGAACGATARLHAERVLKFGALLADARPSAVIVAGTGLATLQCALVARDLGIALVRLGAGERLAAGPEGLVTAALLDRCAELLCVDTLVQRQALAAEGIPARRIVRVGSRVPGLLRALVPRLPTVDTIIADAHPLPSLQRPAGPATGHGLISAQLEPGDVAPDDALQWLLLARHASRDPMPWLWPATAATEQALAAPAVQQQLRGAGIVVVRCDGWLEQLALLRGARCVLAGPAARLADEAAALGVPTIVLDLHAQACGPAEAGLLVRLGPSATQLKATLQRSARLGGADAVVAPDDDAAGALLEQLAIWLAQRDARGRDATWDEAAA